MTRSVQNTETMRRRVGIDIAAKTCSVSRLGESAAKPDRSHTFSQNSEGFAKIAAHVSADGYAPSTIHVVMEATSTYWIGLATFLHGQGFVVSVINPAQAHAFAKALLKRAKTDAIDAQTLAQLARALPLDRWTPPPHAYYELQQRLVQRDSFIALGQQVKNQLHALCAGAVVVESVRERLESVIDTLTNQITAVENEMETAVNHDTAWAESIHRLQTIPGVGLITACWLVVSTLNFTTCASAEALTQYAGLVPQPRESGTSLRGRPHIGHSGHGRLRTALYMASVASLRWNPLLKAFYARLVAKGKAAKVALCAVARKLVHIGFALVTKGEAFDPNFGAAASPPPRIAA